MSIKQHLTSALANIKNDKERAISVAKEKAMREQVVPQHAEINTARDEAIAKITEAHNGKIASMQEAFTAEKQEIINAAEKKKGEVTNSVLECAVATVNIIYDKAISDLEAQISKVEE